MSRGPIESAASALSRDIRIAVRVAARNPGFSILAALLLGIGVGTATTIFSFANALLFRPLPVPHPDRIVRVFGTSPAYPFDVISYPTFLDLRDQSQAFDRLAAHSQVPVTNDLGNDVETVSVELVSGDYFDVFELKPTHGRLLSGQDDRIEGGHAVAVISHEWWRTRMGADPAVVGRLIRLNDYAFTVAGVAPERFRGSYDAFTTDVWVPLLMYEHVRPRGLKIATRGWGWLSATGRLKPGVRITEVQADLDRVAASLRRQFPDSGATRNIRFSSLPAGSVPESMRQEVGRVLIILLVVVGMLLLAACANLAGTLLARTAGRRREIAVRLAIGATPGQIARQWMVEGALLAALGGVAGSFVTFWLRDLTFLLIPLPEDLANLHPNLHADGRVILFAFGVTLIAGLLVGLVPAFTAAQQEVMSGLKETSGGSRRSWRLYRLSLVSQVAVALVLLFGAALALSSVRGAQAFDIGFDTEGLVVASVDLTRPGYDEARGRGFYEEAVTRIASLPGVTRATLGLVVPLGDTRESIRAGIDGQIGEDGRPGLSLAFNIVGADYFSTMGIPIVAGRGFGERDEGPGTRIAIVNETLARRLWPGSSPIGRPIEVIGRATVEVIGVARDIQYYSVGEEPRPYLYLPYGGFYSPNLVFHVRAPGAATQLSGTIRRTLREIDPRVPVVNALTFAELRRVPLLPGRIIMAVSAIFGVLVLLLSCAGLYGLIALTVSQRTRELGVRMVLGADGRNVLGLVIREGMTVVTLGLVLGAAAGILFARGLRSYLFGVSAWDPRLLLFVSGLLASAALAACYLPARRATRIDPIAALRVE